MSGTLHAEQLTNQDLSTIARAHWRELKGQLPDGPNKSSMQAIIGELTYRAEQQHQQGQQQGQMQVSERQGQNQGQHQQFAGASGGNVPFVS